MIENINIPPKIDFAQGLGLIAELGIAVSEITENVKPSENRDNWRKERHESKQIKADARAHKAKVKTEIDLAGRKLKAIVKLLEDGGLSDEEKHIIQQAKLKFAKIIIEA